MLAAACELRHAHPVLARLSPKALRSLARPYFAAGWTTSDVTHALAYRPSATSALPAMPLSRIYAPAGWARSRLAAWRDEAGGVLPGSQQRQVALAAARARHGRTGAASLPDGQLALLPEHIHEHARRLATQAADTVTRNHRRARADRRAGLVPYAQHGPADPRVNNPAGTESDTGTHTRAEAMTAIRNRLARHSQPRSTTTSEQP
jgi:hypothetical protein